MLKKLVKHEFRATSRIMWPIFLGMALLAIFTRVAAIPLVNNGTGFFISGISMLVIIVLMAGTFVLAFVPLVVSGARFKEGILGNEGYLTMTLPVTSHQILISRLITNVIWYSLTGVLMVLIGIIMISGYGNFSFGIGDMFMGFGKNLGNAIKELAPYIGHFILLSVETILDLVAFVTLFTLLVYVSYSIGYSAKKHKSLWTALLIYGLFHVTGWMGILTLIFFGEREHHWQSFETGVSGIEGFFLVCFLIMAAIAAVYYFATNYFITKKLNLE